MTHADFPEDGNRLESADAASPTVGIAGTGMMGTAIAQRLLEVGYEVCVYNRTASKSHPLIDLGAKAARTPADLARTADVTLTLLKDSSVAQQVILGDGGLLEGADSGRSIIVDMGTTRPGDSVRIAAQCRDREVPFIDAPVAGTVEAARSGKLLVMIGGEGASIEATSGIFSALGKEVFHVGGNGDGSRMKLVVNTLLGVSTLALAEALRLAEVFELDLDTAHQVLSSSPSSSRLVVNKGAAMVRGDFAAKASTQTLVKDMSLALEAVTERGAPAPGIQAAHLAFAAASALGMSDLDFSSVFDALRRLGDGGSIDG